MLSCMKILLWDWNGTLLNDAPIAWQAFNDTVAHYGASGVPFAQYQEIYQHPARRMYEAVGIDFAHVDMAKLSDVYHHFYTSAFNQAQLHHDTRDTLQLMAFQGRRQVILSALSHELLPSAVASHGIEHFFESINGSPDRHGDGKVSLGREVVRALEVDGGEVTVIGDSTHDAEVARALGANCILVARGLESAARLQRNGVPVLESFESLPELLVG